MSNSIQVIIPTVFASFTAAMAVTKPVLRALIAATGATTDEDRTDDLSVEVLGISLGAARSVPEKCAWTPNGDNWGDFFEDDNAPEVVRLRAFDKKGAHMYMVSPYLAMPDGGGIDAFFYVVDTAERIR